MLKRVQNTLYRLANADMVFYLLPPLMLLLFAGTVAQKTMGLYTAQKLFFSSFIFWLGPVPLPGGYLLIGILTLTLACKFLLQTDWKFSKSGVNLTHLGVLVFLGGGLLTALDARESYMIIGEGGQSPFIYDYIERELVISSKNGIERIPFDKIEQVELPFNFEVLAHCENCEIKKREDSEQDFGDAPLQSMAQFMALKATKLEKDPEANLSGFTLKLSELENGQDGIYIAFEGMPKPINIVHEGHEYDFIFGKAQRPLPFSIKLLDFTKETYPGTQQARAYSSDVEIIDGNVVWPARIEMNKPLRYKGYTFYQSSFERIEGEEFTILSVVENRGRLFPYIGTAIIAAGLLLHLFLMMRGRTP